MWKVKATEKRAAREACIPKEWKFESPYSEKDDVSVVDLVPTHLSEKELEITNITDPERLALKIATKQYTSKEVALAFSHRAAVAHQYTNCVTEFMFDYAISRAEYLDDYLEKNGKTVGPLHGLPISLKDSFNVPGYDSTIGYISYIGNKDTRVQSNLVTLLLDLGANFHAKTNIPQTLMTADSENNVFGRTLNPNKLSMGAGGSSGGEGALVRLQGSAIGVGTDIAGSIRIPALVNGTYGLKPSINRLPYGNQTGNSESPMYLSFKPVLGPLSNTMKGIEFFFKNVVLANPSTYDDFALPIPFNTKDAQPAEKPLKVGLISTDSYIPVHPPVTEFLEDAAAKLGKAGCQIVNLNGKVATFWEGWTVACGFYSAFVPNDKTCYDSVRKSGEPLIKSIVIDENSEYRPKTLQDYSNTIKATTQLYTKWMEIFRDIDVLICPGNWGTSAPHDKYSGCPYTSMWSVIDFPTIVIPYGKVTKDYPGKHEVPEGLQRWMPAFDSETYQGMIGSVQVVVPKLCEEKLLSCATAIDQILHPENY
ncbi:hypothetical protein OGAPHI_005390 [Ogataea philodendri]|uniref:Amidase domain-containing protein n=2 Tax=Ogataea TaxID=461281 RepID=A0A9P8P1H3_9ASCO|nr:uncharacterized protein OGAPHI_005390 [Ogataea philodendri]KAH3663400.1 hypothetical protein OGAPHI_005390 [Ogataea philodendri]